ncbi:ATPase family AAA domain-containing protein 1 [Nymphon striatum]|nr:ATPase family AAA domain-containing protein 1 [Nymphon striatum]
MGTPFPFLTHDKLPSLSVTKNEIIVQMIKIGSTLVSAYLFVRLLSKFVDPTYQARNKQSKLAKRILKRLGIGEVELTEHELMVASQLIEPALLSNCYEEIGGLDDVITNIKDSVILPLQNPHIFSKSDLVRPPKGLLLYGPPGCGKTMIAKATAKETNARFINLDISMLTDKWYGESQKITAAIFSLAYKIQPTIIFIDEIVLYNQALSYFSDLISARNTVNRTCASYEIRLNVPDYAQKHCGARAFLVAALNALLRSRRSDDHEATLMIKSQFMSLWDGLITDKDCRVVVMGATNRPLDLDRAIVRRMPAMFHIKPPNTLQREKILNLILCQELVDDAVDFKKISQDTPNFSGSDLKELCRNASLSRVKEYFEDLKRKESNLAEDNIKNDDLRPINASDFAISLAKMKNAKFDLDPLHLD